MPPDLEPLAQSVLAEALRNVAKHAEPTRVGSRSARDEDTFTLEVRNDGVRRGAARGRHGSAAGRLRGAAARRRGRVRGPPARTAGACGWSCRWPRSHRERPRPRTRRGAGCGCWSSTTTTSCTGGSALLLGEQPWVERCLSRAPAHEALELTAATPARRARRPVPGRRVRRRVCESIARRLAGHARAADLGRRAHVAGRGACGGRLGLRLQGLGRRRRGARGAHGRARDDGVRAQGQQPAPLLSEREREVLDLIAAGSTNREIAAAAVPLPHTVKEHTSAAVPQARARNRAEAVQRAQRVGLLD